MVLEARESRSAACLLTRSKRITSSAAAARRMPPAVPEASSGTTPRAASCRAARTSLLTILPPGPDPAMPSRETSCSRAIRRADGEEKRLPPVGAGAPTAGGLTAGAPTVVREATCVCGSPARALVRRRECPLSRCADVPDGAQDGSLIPFGVERLQKDPVRVCLDIETRLLRFHRGNVLSAADGVSFLLEPAHHGASHYVLPDLGHEDGSHAAFPAEPNSSRSGLTSFRRLSSWAPRYFSGS